TVRAVVALFGVCYVIPAFAHAAVPFAAALAALGLFWWLGGREGIEIDGAHVLGSRSGVGGQRARASLRAGIGSLDAAGLRLRDGRTVPIARNLGHRPESLDWLARRLARASGVGDGGRLA